MSKGGTNGKARERNVLDFVVHCRAASERAGALPPKVPSASAASPSFEPEADVFSDEALLILRPSKTSVFPAVL